MIRRHLLKIVALILVLLLWFCVIVMGRGRYNPVRYIGGVLTISGIGDGGLTNYDLCVGDVDGYGMARVGCFAFGVTNYDIGDMNLDRTVVFRNLEGPASGLIEFIWEEGNGNTRLAIPTSGPGNAAWWPRSVFLAGPATTDANSVTVGFHQRENNIFHNLVCDTALSGAEFGVQGNVEFEKIVFVDDIQESTSGAGITFGNPIKVTGLAAYADNAAAVAGGLTAGAFYRTGGDPDVVCVVH